MNGLGLGDEDDRQRDGNARANEPRPAEPSNVHYEAPTQAESARQMGLGYAAGITFFATIVFMLFLGWGADLVLGSSPWGIVGGIVLGAVIAFVQFFRITSRIYNKPNDLPSVRPLSSSDDDERL